MVEKQLVQRIQKSIDYIEDHLLEKIVIEDIAKITFMSQSSFYIVFSSVLGTTVKDYIRKRRLSLSAYDLIKSDRSVLNIALKYQYCTYESYSRAFKKLFGISPKKYREKNVYTNVFPRVALTYFSLVGGDLMIDREMNKDIIVKKINGLQKGYILDIDIDHFEEINNNYGYNIGDKVLIKVPERINEVLSYHKVDADVTRINNDEFAVIIKDKSEDFIVKLSADIIQAMSQVFIFGELSVNLTVSIGISDFTVHSNDKEVIRNANKAMLQAKRNGKNQYIILK